MDLEKFILAVVTTDGKKVRSGAPIFICDTKEELETTSYNLEAILDGIAHELSEGLVIVVKH